MSCLKQLSRIIQTQLQSASIMFIWDYTTIWVTEVIGK